MDAEHVGDDIVEILFTEEQIQARIAEMAARIEADYEGKDLLIVGVLRGAIMVIADLARSLGRHVEIDDEIIDTGLTLSWLLANLTSRGPASVEIATLLRKPEAVQMPIDVKYV